MLASLLRMSFPVLRSVTVIAELEFDGEVDDWSPPWLHTIAIGRPIPGILKMIALEQHCYGMEHNIDCGKLLMGTGEEVDGSKERLPELLAGLEGLTIRLGECKHPGRSVAHVWSVLPGMRRVLRFEYRSRGEKSWKPYTRPDTQ